MKSLSVLILMPLMALSAVADAKPLELPAIQVVPIKASGTGRNYELYIKLPEDYDAGTDKKHPVIYFTDAMWHIELLSAATAFLLEEAILVGISWQKDINAELLKEQGAHVSRYRDYSIGKSNNPGHQAKYQFGQASKHLAFIRDDVIRYVEKHYHADPDKRAYFGYSLGGLFGAYILLAKSNTFKSYMLGSPSVWRLFELESVAAANPNKLNANVFISYGTLEEALSEHVDAFVALLKSRNDKSLSLTRQVLEGSHQTAFPSTGVRSVTWLSSLQKEEVK